MRFGIWKKGTRGGRLLSRWINHFCCRGLVVRRISREGAKARRREGAKATSKYRRVVRHVIGDALNAVLDQMLIEID